MKKIIAIEKLEHIVPNGSCGTGYSEPDKLRITCEDGSVYTWNVDIWYLGMRYIKDEFFKEMTEMLNGEGFNYMEAYKLYLDAVAETSTPWTAEEIYNCLS